MVASNETIIGRISAVFGVKGWVKVHSFTEPMDNILGYKRWTLSLNGVRRQYDVLEGRPQGRGLVARLRGVDDRDQAQALCGAEILIGREELPDLPEGEYYWYQLEGLVVTTVNGQRLGVVDHLMETGANDVLVVRGDAQSVDQRERLIPYLPEQVVTEINLTEGSLIVDWDPDF